MTTPHTAPQQATIWGEWIIAPPAPEPPEWIEDEQPICVEIILEQEEEYEAMMDWWLEQQEEYAIEDDAEFIRYGC